MKKYMLHISLLLSTTLFSNALFAQNENTTNSTTVQKVKETKINRHIDIEDDKQSENSKQKNSREISQNITVTKNVELSIENTYRNIVIKTWNKPMINLSTTIYYEGEDKFSESEWFEKLNIFSKTYINADVSNVRIKSEKMNRSYNSENENVTNYSDAYYNRQGDNFGTEKNKKRTITITVPVNTKLDIENKYANLNIENNINEAKLNISNGSVDMQDATTLLLRSKYSNVMAGNITKADLDIANGKFGAKKVSTLEIDSKYTTLEIDQVNTANIKSSNDEYEFENVGTIIGRKNYGSIRINNLSKTIDIEGSNADVKIKNISNDVALIRFDNKYADIRIPMKNVSNYKVEFEGNYSTIYSSFERKKVEDNTKTSNAKTLTYSSPTSTTSSTFGSNTSSNSNCGCDSKFTAAVGNGNGTTVIMKCENCTVDFK